MRVSFFGNQASQHIATWAALYRNIGIDVRRFASIHPVSGQFAEEWAIGVPRIPRMLLYILLGFKAFLTSRVDLVHAHGASGYGLAAWLSGRDYVVTVYGSEIFDERRSWLYRAMVRLVLHRALAVTVTSEDARRYVCLKFKIDKGKVFCFHTGIDALELGFLKPLDEPGAHFLSVRNAAQHYRVDQIVSAYVEIADTISPNPSMTVIQGNGPEEYWGAIKRRYAGRVDITFVDGRLSHSELMTLVAGSSICVSFPQTDQLSTTILEVLFFERVLVCSDLSAYSPLLAQGLSGVYLVGEAEELAVGMRKAADYSAAGGKSHCKARVKAGYAYHASAEKLRAMLDCVGVL